MEKRIKGLDTIVGGGEQPPKRGVVLTHEQAKAISKGQHMANMVGIATIPYCGVCKVPLDWLYRQFNKNPKVGYLECPKCFRQWGVDLTKD